MKEGADRGDCRVQVPPHTPQLRGKRAEPPGSGLLGRQEEREATARAPPAEGGGSVSPAGWGSAAPALPPLLFFPLSTRASPISSERQSRALLGAGRERERQEPAPVAPCSLQPGQRGLRAPRPPPGLTSSMAATVFLHWAIRVVKLEAVGDL